VSSGRRTKHGCSAAQLAIAWLLDQEGVIVIPHSYLRLTASLGRMHPKPNAASIPSTPRTSFMSN
jgi:aryl-alcohol dehydrogenase-like predicted oxidoreductase